MSERGKLAARRISEQMPEEALVLMGELRNAVAGAFAAAHDIHDQELATDVLMSCRHIMSICAVLEQADQTLKTTSRVARAQLPTLPEVKAIDGGDGQ